MEDRNSRRPPGKEHVTGYDRIGSIETLLDRDVRPGDRQDATDHVGARPDHVDVGTESVVIFRLHGEWLALPTNVFEGVAPLGAVHSLPGRRDGALLGITNVHGELMACVSVAALLGIAAGAQGASTQITSERLVILRGPDGTIVVPSHEVHGVYRYRTEEVRDVPATLARVETRYTIGLFPWNGRMVARLDETRFFDAVARALG